MSGLEIFIYVAVLLFSVMIHEVAHAYAAYKRGDDTAKLAGRITLNPAPHIDIFGSIILPAAMLLFHSPLLFGWAKPVPLNYAKLKNPRFDSVLVSAAGPLSNAVLALSAGLAMRLLKAFSPSLQGLDGSLAILLSLVVMVNAVLLVLNLLPLPPLDGSKIFAYFLPRELAYKYLNLNPFICFAILLLVLSTGFFWKIVVPILNVFMTIIIGK